MNLASRCREAISHVAMLKKDLATSQRRTAEVIHNYQRQHVDSMRNAQAQAQQVVVGAGGGAASTANTAKQQQHQQLPPNEIAFIPGTADIAGATAATAAAAPRSAAEKMSSGPQPSPRALNVARDLEQMDELLINNAATNTTATTTTTKNSTRTNGNGGSNTMIRVEPEGMAAVVASPAFVVQTLEQPPSVTDATTPPALAETLVAAAINSIAAPPLLTACSTAEKDDEEAGTGSGGISPSSYPLSEPVDSDDFEDVYNQADASIPVTTRPLLPTAVAAAATTPPMSPSSSKPPLMGKNNDDDDEDDSDGEDPSDVVGDTTTAARRSSGPGSSSNLVSAFFPHSASPKLGRGGVGGGYNEEFPGDITAVARKPSSTRSRLGRLSGFAEMDDETSSGVIPTINNRMSGRGIGGGGGPQEDKSTLSSIDAFEASFRITDFPETFSPRESSTTVSEEKKSSTGEQPYNPFFPSPQKGRPGADDSLSALSMPVGGTIKSGFVASLVAASKENAAAAAAAAAQEQQQRDSSLSPTSLQHSHRFFESKRSKDPPGRDRTSPRSLIKNTGIVTNSPKQKLSVSLSAKDGLAPPRSSSLSSPRSSSLLQRRMAAVTPISQQQEQKSPGVSTAAAAPPAMDMEKFRSPNTFNSKASSSTPTIVTNNSTPATPLSPGRSSPTNENGGSGTGSGSAMGSAAGVAVEPKRPEKAGYDLARLRYEKALANRKPRTPNFDNADNNSATSSQGTGGKSSSQPRRSSIDSASNCSNNNDGTASKPSTTPKENKNNANASSAEAGGEAATEDSTPPSTILTSPKSPRRAPSEQQQQAGVSTPPKRSQPTTTSTATSPPSKMAIVDGQPVVSVRDRLSMFSDRTPRSPEKEAARLQAIATGRRLDLDTSYEDEGDIPLPTSINRKSAAAEIAASAELSNSTHSANSATIGSVRNKPFPPKSPGNSSVNSGGGGGYINGANQNAANTSTSLTRHRPWDSNNNNIIVNAANDEMDFNPTVDSKISPSNATSTAAAADVTSTSGLNNKPRRSVAHPVSYAEPSLRTKLRNGDMYFPKDEGVFTTTTAMPAAAAATNNAE
jgi:Shugoshin C terminus